jgi:hypothetical protein
MGRRRAARSRQEPDARDQGRHPPLLRKPPRRKHPAARVLEPSNPITLLLVHQLMLAHENGLALSRELLMAQGVADEAELEAVRSFDLAAARPWDEELADHAVAAAVASEQASEHELETAAQWSAHCARMRAQIKELRKQLPIVGS